MSDRLARWIWWFVLQWMRKTPVGKFNRVVADRLGGAHGAAFLERGKRQNAFARRHALTVIRISLQIVGYALLIGILTIFARWMYENGYLSAPKQP